MIRKIVCVNALIVIVLSALFLVYPPIRAFISLQDPALRQPGVPKVAWRLFRNLTPRYEAWAKARTAGSQAEIAFARQHFRHGMAAVWIGILFMGLGEFAGSLGCRRSHGRPRTEGFCP